MKLSALEKSLIKAMEEFEIIDAHEHLPSEKARIQAEVDVFILVSHYTRHDLHVAGMSGDDYETLYKPEVPLEHRWSLFAPYWEQIRWSSYARAALLAAQKFYGFADINKKTYQPLSEAIKKANKKGIYEKVLSKTCKIRTALTQGISPAEKTPLLTPVVRMPLMTGMSNWKEVSHPAFAPQANIRSLDGYLNAAYAYIRQAKKEGAVGLKMVSNPYGPPDRKVAVKAFNSLQNSKKTNLGSPNPLGDYVLDRVICFAQEQDLTIAVHTGYWGDFRQLDPLHMIPILQRHPKARFDIYHVGYPWMREALMLGKGFANVWLNFCWTHIISQRFATIALDEAMDLIPMNKLIAFGGDYGKPVEKVYGHLVMAREDVAKVLASRIESGQMTEKQALEIAHKWFYENPKELYRLKV